MFSFFRSDPSRKLRNAWQAKLTEAMQAQRNGDIRSYAFLTAEADRIKAELDTLES